MYYIFLKQWKNHEKIIDYSTSHLKVKIILYKYLATI